ncbi:MAG: triose-phosphate isomerase [Minisyncoccia bacterium]
MSIKKKIIVGNWKMNPDSLIKAKEIVQNLKKSASKFAKIKPVICPPFIYLPEVAFGLKNTKNFSLGAQDVHFVEEGAHTGEVSLSMLKSLGCKYVIVGHSERRETGETDEMVSKKVGIVSKGGLVAILCVGEKSRDGHGDFWHTLREQITKSLNKVNRPMLKNLVIAYEPVWAISGKHAMTGKDLHQTVIFIRKTLSDIYGRDCADKISILYGGSVGPKNTIDLIQAGTADGLLIGRESLKVKDFVQVLEIVNNLK